MAPDTAGPSRFKSRFSLLSLIPARHPPLQISAPRPLPPTQFVAARQPTIISVTDTTVSPVHSEYPDTTYSNVASPIPQVPPMPIAKQAYKDSHKTFQPHRPPPLDLTKTKEAYPGVPGVLPTAGTIVPDRPVRPDEEKDAKAKKESKKKEQKIKLDDPFEAVEIEPGHKYTSWKGGRVSIRPGQIIPHGHALSGSTPTIRGLDPDNHRRFPPRQSDTYLSHFSVPDQDQYESVLHNVLLTPTYIAPSPAVPPTPSPDSTTGEWQTQTSKRRTLLNAMKGGSKWILPRGVKESEADRAIIQMREREQREMERFRMANRPVRITSREPVIHVYPSGSATPNPQYGHRRSPGSREWNIGVAWSGRDSKARHAEADRAWREKGEKEEAKMKKRQRLWKIAIICAIVCLAALVIGLCTSLLTGSSNKDKSSSSASTGSNNTETPSSTNDASASTPAPSDTSRTLATCLELFSTSSPTSPLTYPCGDCVPLLTSTTNDYNQNIINGNSTGVGAALQFCGLMDVYKATSSSGLQVGGWMKDGSPCGWTGVTCDGRGRVTELQLKYPDVPDKVPGTLSNLVSLQTFRIMGNTTSPSGAFPSGILALPNISTVDVEYTALTGPLASVDIGQAKNLGTLVLVNNQQLGKDLPSLSSNGQLKTLAVTGQSLGKITEGNLPTSLTYLDLSYNAFSGQVPSFTSLNFLQTLYLTNNNYTSPPSTLPGSLSSLSLTANPSLTGFMPSQVCSNSALTSCDLRSTKLRGPNMIPSALSGISFPGQASQSTSSGGSSTLASSSTASASAVATGKVCGVCKFDS